MKILIFVIQTFFIIFILSCSIQLFAAEKKTPELVDIIVTTSAEDLLLFATVKNGFSEKMITGVENGLPVSFTFHIELDRIRAWWFNDNLADYEITRTLT